MSRQVSPSSAGEDKADERARVARLSWRLPDRAFPGAVLLPRGRWMCCAGFPCAFGLPSTAAAQVAIVKEMTGRNRAAQLEIVKQMSRQ